MTQWERNICPDCTLVWERNLDGIWRYIAMVSVPLPAERTCPVCASGFHMQWEKVLPVLPENANNGQV